MSATGRVLRWSAVAATAGIVAALLPGTLSDSGGATAYLLGVPLAIAAAVAIADVTGHALGTVTTLAALAMVAWGLLLALGYGFYFVIPALLLGAAAVTSPPPRDIARTPSP